MDVERDAARLGGEGDGHLALIIGSGIGTRAEISALSPLFEQINRKSELVHLYEAFYASDCLTLFYPYFTLFYPYFYLTLPLVN